MPYKVSADPEQTQITSRAKVSKLTLRLLSDLIPVGSRSQLKIKCLATLHHVYHRSNEVSVQTMGRQGSDDGEDEDGQFVKNYLPLEQEQNVAEPARIAMNNQEVWRNSETSSNPRLMATSRSVRRETFCHVILVNILFLHVLLKIEVSSFRHDGSKS